MWSLCAILLVLIIYLVWLYGTRSEQYRSCPEKGCSREVVKGCPAINPFVWPWSGGACYDVPKEGFEDHEDFSSGSKCAIESRDHVDDSNDNLSRSLRQEYDHETLST